MRVAFLIVLLAAGIARADTADEATDCIDVPECAALAATTPERFTKRLIRLLRSLPAVTLVEGLDWSHERPAVTQRGLTVVRGALANAMGHDARSATRLLELATGPDCAEWAGHWMRALAQDPEGRRVLGDWLQVEQSHPLRLASMIMWVEGAGRGGGVDSSARNSRRQAFVEHLWQRFLDARANDVVEVVTRADIEAGRGWGVFSHVTTSEEYRERLRTLLRADLLAGRPLTKRELSVLVELVEGDSKLGDELLDRAESARIAERAAIISASLQSLDLFASHERPRLLRLLIAVAIDGVLEKDLVYFLEKFVYVASPWQAEVLSDLALASEQSGEVLLRTLADRWPAYRSVYLARLEADDSEFLSRTAYSLASWDRRWASDAAAQLLARFTEDDLREEPVQERIISLSPLLRTRELNLPRSRRQRTGSGRYLCYMGPVMARWNAQREWDDRAAFGLPQPAMTPEEQVPEAGRPGHRAKVDIPAAPPMTPQESAVRAHRFVLAWPAVRALAKDAATLPNGTAADLAASRADLEDGRWREALIRLAPYRFGEHDVAALRRLVLAAGARALSERAVFALHAAQIVLRHDRSDAAALELAVHATSKIEEWAAGEAYLRRLALARPGPETVLEEAAFAYARGQWERAIERASAVKSQALGTAALERHEEIVAGARLALAEREARRAALAETEPVLYSTEWCTACDALRGWLKARSVSFAEKDVEKDPTARRELDEKLRVAGIESNAVPILDFAGVLVVGFDQEKLETLLGR